MKFIFSFGSMVLLAFVTVFTYLDIIDLFYQQDEWQTIGNNIILYNLFELFKDRNLLQFISVQERFGSNILSYFLMGVFAFNTKAMGIYSLFFHIINSLLVYLIIRRWIIKDNVFALLGSLFFAVSAVSTSAVSWFGTSLGTLPATTLILISLICYFQYIQSKAIKWIILTVLFLYVSFFFKEIGIFLLVFLPLATLLFQENQRSYIIKKFWPFFIIFLLVVSIRLVNLVFLSDRSGELFVTSSEQNFVSTIITRAIVYPITSFALTFVPSDPLVSFAKYFTNIYYPFIPSEQFNLVAQTLVLDIFAVFLTCIFLIVIYFSVKKAPLATKKMVIFWIIFFILSFLPYVLLSKSYAYLESRYYYLANLPAGILLGVVGLSLKTILDKKRLGVLSIFIVAAFLIIHIKYIKDNLYQLTLVSKERIGFLNQILEIKPQLHPEKNIFYITGNRDFYIPGNNVPFQQGMGYTLMTWYYSRTSIPKELIGQRFLWDLSTQGYKEINGLGFGFFNNKSELNKIMLEYHLADENITALYYDSKAQKLKRIYINE